MAFFLAYSRLATTAFTSNAVPSVNFTPVRSFSSSVLVSVNFQEVASHGVALPSLSTWERRTPLNSLPSATVTSSSPNRPAPAPGVQRVKHQLLTSLK